MSQYSPLRGNYLTHISMINLKYAKLAFAASVLALSLSPVAICSNVYGNIYGNIYVPQEVIIDRGDDTKSTISISSTKSTISTSSTNSQQGVIVDKKDDKKDDTNSIKSTNSKKTQKTSNTWDSKCSKCSKCSKKSKKTAPDPGPMSKSERKLRTEALKRDSEEIGQRMVIQKYLRGKAKAMAEAKAKRRRSLSIHLKNLPGIVEEGVQRVSSHGGNTSSRRSNFSSRSPVTLELLNNSPTCNKQDEDEDEMLVEFYKEEYEKIDNIKAGMQPQPAEGEPLGPTEEVTDTNDLME